MFEHKQKFVSGWIITQVQQWSRSNVCVTGLWCAGEKIFLSETLYTSHRAWMDTFVYHHNFCFKSFFVVHSFQWIQNMSKSVRESRYLSLNGLFSKYLSWTAVNELSDWMLLPKCKLLINMFPSVLRRILW